jgi:DNA-binding cell septation regulator SpoVG
MSVPKPLSESNQTSSSSKIRVIAIRRVGKGPVRIIADIGLGPSLIIKELKIIQQPGQRAWVSPPQYEWQGTDGGRHFAPLVELSGTLKARVEQAILQMYGRSSEEGSTHV